MEYICLCGKNFGNAKKAFRAHNKTCQDKPKSFNCQFCGKEISRKCGLVYHELRCELNPNRETNLKKMSNNGGGTSGKELPSKEGGWKCPYCSEIFRTRRLFQKHNKEAHNSKRGSGIQDKSIKQYCQFCNREFYRVCSKNLHEKYCKQNPNGIRRESRLHSEETKKKISEHRKKYLEEHPDKIPYVMNHSSKISYPEKYFMEVFKDLPVKYNYQVGLYQLDFAIPEKLVYIEIDGEQHFCDKRIVEHDKERTEKLESLGWNCLKRVRWSDYKKLNQEQQKQYCNELIQLLSK